MLRVVGRCPINEKPVVTDQPASLKLRGATASLQRRMRRRVSDMLTIML